MAGADGAKGNVLYTNSNGVRFQGKVTGYRQNLDGTVACFVGTITKATNTAWQYFYVAVADNGEGALAAPDAGVRVLVDASPFPLGVPFTPDLSLATGYYEAFTGNVQIHK